MRAPRGQNVFPDHAALALKTRETIRPFTTSSSFPLERLIYPIVFI